MADSMKLPSSKIYAKRKQQVLFEIKFMKNIGINVKQEVQEKIKRLKVPSQYSIRPILVYEGKLTKELNEDEYFIHKLPFSNFIR